MIGYDAQIRKDTAGHDMEKAKAQVLHIKSEV